MSQAVSSEQTVDVTEGFGPILGGDASVLILGTLPSQQSLKKNQYYGHPRNVFWPIMGRLFGADPALDYEVRTQFLVRRGVAVWDVLASGARPGSMDAAIEAQSARPNDFAKFHENHPELRMVCFNGQAAARLFVRLVPGADQESFASVKFVTMPSTSPAFAAMSFEEKLLHWSVITQK